MSSWRDADFGAPPLGQKSARINAFCAYYDASQPAQAGFAVRRSAPPAQGFNPWGTRHGATPLQRPLPAQIVDSALEFGEEIKHRLIAKR